MADLSKLFVHVPSALCAGWRSKHFVGGVTAPTDTYYNKIVFLEQTQEIVTHGKSFGGGGGNILDGTPTYNAATGKLTFKWLAKPDGTPIDDTVIDLQSLIDLGDIYVNEISKRFLDITTTNAVGDNDTNQVGITVKTSTIDAAEADIEESDNGFKVKDGATTGLATAADVAAHVKTMGAAIAQITQTIGNLDKSETENTSDEVAGIKITVAETNGLVDKPKVVVTSSTVTGAADALTAENTDKVLTGAAIEQIKTYIDGQITVVNGNISSSIDGLSGSSEDTDGPISVGVSTADGNVSTVNVEWDASKCWGTYTPSPTTPRIEPETEPERIDGPNLYLKPETEPTDIVAQS